MTSTFFVPVAASKAGTLALRTGRLRSGERVGLAFTSEASLLLALGPAQQWIHLGGYALRDMLAPLGVEQVRVDPRPVGELRARWAAPSGMCRPPRSRHRAWLRIAIPAIRSRRRDGGGYGFGQVRKVSLAVAVRRVPPSANVTRPESV